MKTLQTPHSALATEILREDHRRVKELFRQFAAADSQALKKQLGDLAIRELEIHGRLEEELFYPAARRAVADRGLLAQALEAHHVADLLIEELKELPAGLHYAAKFQLLRNNVLEHIEEEEEVLLPQVESSGLDLGALGQEMTEMKLSCEGGYGWSEERDSGRLGAAAGFGLLAVLGAAAWALLAPGEKS